MNIFDFAIELERSGRRYYRNLAGKTALPGVKRIYSMMAEDEAALLDKFRTLREKTPNATMKNSLALETVENIFRDALDEGEALAVESDLDAYNYVMSVERRICRLYEEAAAREKQKDVKALLLKIAGEERRELESLRQVFDFVNAPNEFLAWGEFSNLGEFYNFGRDEGA